MWSKIWRRLGLVLLLGGTLLATMVGRYLFDGGLFHVLAQHVPATCSAIDLGGNTFRDMAVDQTTGMLYVSTGGASENTGAIKRVDLTAAELKLEPALSKAPTNFTPDVIGLFSMDGTRRLFAVNRAVADHPTLEMFDYGEDGLWSHAANMRDTRFQNPADVQPVGPDAFYIANRPSSRNPVETGMEMLLGRNKGTLIYNNGERTIAAVIEMAGAGGLGISPDGKMLYVTQPLSRDVRTYEREPLMGSMKNGKSIKVPGAPRHLEVAADGSLWVALDPQLGWGERAPAKGAPTQIIRIEDPNTDPKITEPYVALDGSFSAATVAVPFGNRLAIGSPVESHIQVCTLP